MYKKLKPAIAGAKDIPAIIETISTVTKLPVRGIVGKIDMVRFREARFQAIMICIDLHPELKLIDFGPYFNGRSPNHINQYYRRAKVLYDTCDIFKAVNQQIYKKLNA